MSKKKTLLVAAAAAAGTVTTSSSGTANNLAKFTAAAQIANSTITDDGSTIIIKPGANGTTAVRFTKSDGTTDVFDVDTTNAKITIPFGSAGLVDASNNGSGANYGFNGPKLGSGALVQWSPGGPGSGTFDTGLGRNNVGIVEIDSGTLGTLRDLALRKITSYGNATAVATAGWGVPAIYSAGRATAQTAANASVATYTNGATDGSFEVSANVLVTASTTHNFTVTVAYTDEGNTARTLTLNFASLAGVLATAIINTGGTVPYEGVPMHIRCKASTAITVATTGTFTSVTYNVEGIIKQMA
jgi:hypothetical protein